MFLNHKVNRYVFIHDPHMASFILLLYYIHNLLPNVLTTIVFDLVGDVGNPQATQT